MKECSKKYKIKENSIFFDFLLHKVFKQIHNHESIMTKFDNEMKKCNSQESYYHIMMDYNDMKGFNINTMSLYRLFFDKSMNFYLCKEFHPSIPEKLKNRELEIMKKKSKFLISISDIGKKNFIPYCPMGSLLEIIIDNEIKFSIVDKIVIILEIASALNDMHFHGQYHGNLSNRMIYINSSKDAYIGSICYNRESAYFSPVPLNEFYFQSPECFKNDGDF